MLQGAEALNRPWVKHYDPGVPKTLNYPKGPIYTLLEEAAKIAPGHIAVRIGDKQITYHELLEHSLKKGKLFQDLGVKKGDRIALLLPNGIDFIECFWGVLMAGGVVAPVNPAFTRTEVKAIMKQVEPSFVLTLPEFTNKVSLKYPVVLATNEAQSHSFRPADVSPDDDALIVFTGGTTGRPKGCVFSHKNYMASIWGQLSWSIPLGQNISLGERQVLFTLPMTHIFGLTSLGYSVKTVTPMLILPKFDVNAVVEYLAKEKFSYFPCVPTMLGLILLHPRVLSGEVVVRDSVRNITLGGAPCSPRLKNLVAKHGLTVYEGWAMTETCSRGISPPVLGNRELSDKRVPVPEIDIRIVNPETGAEVAIGQAGELLVRGPSVMKGYLGNEVENRRSFTKDGWFRTGDTAKIDESGYVHILGRVKEIILHGGNTIYPQEVDTAILEFSNKVLDVITFGEPDDIYGENVVSVVRAPDLNIDELKEYLKQRLAPYKIPSRIVVTSEPLTRTPAGKPLRKLVAEKYGRENS